MKQTITIKGVDVKLLEKQRKIINGSLVKVDIDYGSVFLDAKEVDALQGVMSMLDAWSDEIYHNKNSKEVGR